MDLIVPSTWAHSLEIPRHTWLESLRVTTAGTPQDCQPTPRLSPRTGSWRSFTHAGPCSELWAALHPSFWPRTASHSESRYGSRPVLRSSPTAALTTWATRPWSMLRAFLPFGPLRWCSWARSRPIALQEDHWVKLQIQSTQAAPSIPWAWLTTPTLSLSWRWRSWRTEDWPCSPCLDSSCKPSSLARAHWPIWATIWPTQLPTTPGLMPPTSPPDLRLDPRV